MTRTLEKILIAVDDSPASLTAVEQGLAIAAEEQAEVVFVHVVPQTYPPSRVKGE